MKTNRSLLFSAVVVTGLVVAACGGDESSADEAGENNSTEMVDVSFSAVPSMTSIGLHVANDLGFFEEEGINAEIVDFDSGSASEQAMLTGEVDFGAGGVVSTLLMEAAGESVTNLVLFQSSPIFTFVVRSDLADEITSLEDLEGRSVGISSEGSLTDFFARLSLHEIGLDPDNDVDIVGSGGTDGHVAALEAGQVDVQLTWEPGTTQATEVTGVSEILADLRTDDAPGRVGELVGSSMQGLDSKIDEDPELAEAIVRAVVKADNAIREDPSVLADALENHLFTDLPREQVERIAEIEGASFRPEISQDDVQAWVDVYIELGFLEEPIEPSSVLDERFAELWTTQ